MTIEPRCYTLAQVLERAQIPTRTFFTLKKAGKLPWLQEILPRAGRLRRYRADLVDRYLAGQWNQPRVFGRRAS